MISWSMEALPFGERHLPVSDQQETRMLKAVISDYKGVLVNDIELHEETY